MKMKICRICLFSIAALMLLTASAFAENHYDVSLRANQSAIEGDAEALLDLSPNPGTLTLGANAVYDADDFNFIGLRALMGSNIFTNGLTGKIGFKGVLGTVQRKGPDSSLVNLGFMVSASYDMSAAFPDYIVPLVASAALTFSPQPLCFNDTKEFTEATVDLDWKIMDNAAINVGYRYLKLKFDSPVHWQKTDNAALVGFKFFF